MNKLELIKALKENNGLSKSEAAKIGMIYGSAEAPGEIKSNTELMAQAENLGKKLAAREHYPKERYNGNK